MTGRAEEPQGSTPAGPAAPVLPSPTPLGRRRPSGEPPPLPRQISRSTRLFLVLGLFVAMLWVALSIQPLTRGISIADRWLLLRIARVRTDALTTFFEAVHSLGSYWVVRTVEWVTLVVLVVTRRFQHLFTLLATILVLSAIDRAAAFELGRMRPTGIEVIGVWSGYAHPSIPIAALGVAVVGVLYTVVPAGSRRRVAWLAAVPLVLLCVARLYLAVDHPTDVVAGLVTGVALPIAAFRLVVPEEVFPVGYGGGNRAHLDVGGRRGEAIAAGIQAQLGLEVLGLEPFALAGSAGSTPLRLRVRAGPGEPETLVFGKLYALSHLRSDRWYKLVRTVLYGRLEDELPFNAVRRLVQYEDHMTRLMRDAGVPVPRPYGIVEITPEREYLFVTELLDGAVELGDAEVDDGLIDDALGLVRRLWDAGLAHRDIKPSNVLVFDGQPVLVDVAFAEARPTPWRQAVDLANMMLTLALRSDAERVYDRALLQFGPDDIAEAFAASRGVTIPTQLRAGLRADGRDLHARFRDLAPDREPVSIQRWSVRRIGITLAALAGIVAGVALLVVNLQFAGLL